jgi:histidinol phosphatase-like enzyme (inositol monophosphatase family)
MYDLEIKTMREAAISAGTIQLGHRNGILSIETKSDASPVTQVDKLCESMIRSIILKQFPGDGFLGEESGYEKGTSGRKWIVDPLDGTRPYIRNIPTYSVLIALEEDENLVAGCMNFPAMNELCWAGKGCGAFLNNDRIHVSQTTHMKQIFGSGFGFVEKAGTKDADQLLLLMQQWNYAYGFMDAYTYRCVANGSIDVCVNLLDKPWDCAAAACIIQEAGGRYSNLSGQQTVYSGSCIVSNGLVHEDVVEYFLNSNTIQCTQ